MTFKECTGIYISINDQVATIIKVLGHFVTTIDETTIIANFTKFGPQK